jgi:hypothetical protein
MARSDQPYLPLYVDDWMNNNKLKLSSSSAHGLMISIMCIMHKEDTYGKILLKQKFKQTDEQIKNFASQIAKLTAFDLLEILPALTELIENNIIKIKEDILICERMVRDNEISEKRKEAGQSGGKATQKNNKKDIIKDKNFALAKDKANTVIGNVNEIVNEIVNEYEDEKIPNKGVFDFEEKLIEFGFEKKLVTEWLVIRKKKKAINSETAFNRFINEIEKCQKPINEILEYIVSKSWQGFEASWLNNNLNNNGNKKNTRALIEHHTDFGEL